MRINENLHEMAVMNDKIRNPLAVILTACEMCEVSAANPRVLHAVDEIDDLIKEIDSGWVESEKVRSYLFKNYHMEIDKN